MDTELPTREELAELFRYAAYGEAARPLCDLMPEVRRWWLDVAQVAIEHGAKVREPDVAVMLPPDVAHVYARGAQTLLHEAKVEVACRAALRMEP